jgi:hypothetical protein
MDNTATNSNHETLTVETKQLHPQVHVDNHSIYDAVRFSTILSIICFLPFGLLVGIDRGPGPFLTYGLSYFFWPMVAAVGLGAMFGGGLGFIIGAIMHASDPTPEPTKVDVPKATPPEKIGPVGLTLHSKGR